MAVEVIANKEHLTLEGLRKIVAIRASINKGLTPKLKESFLHIIPVPRPTVEDQKKNKNTPIDLLGLHRERDVT